MSAHYDQFDYPSYWRERGYEHKAEIIALNDFFDKIKNFNYIADVGGGYGRLTHTYLHRAKRVYLTDPSKKLLSIAQKNNKSKKIRYIHSSVENLESKIKKNSLDVVIFVRVLHHIEDINKSFEIINKILKKGGYLILEFPNKLHIKSLFNECRQGNITCFLDIFPKDIRSKKSKTKKTINFYNYHPDDIFDHLEKNGFDIQQIKSVSNIRSAIVKRILPIDIILYLEKRLQKIFTMFRLGPSIFILAKKK